MSIEKHYFLHKNSFNKVNLLARLSMINDVTQMFSKSLWYICKTCWNDITNKEIIFVGDVFEITICTLIQRNVSRFGLFMLKFRIDYENKCEDDNYQYLYIHHICFLSSLTSVSMDIWIPMEINSHPLFCDLFCFLKKKTIWKWSY